MDLQTLTTLILTRLASLGLQIVGALALFVIGRWLIGFVVGRVTGALQKQHVDPTVLRYVGNIVSVGLNVLLVVALLGYFGVETTTFAALLAGAGLAIGAAWSGLLANFAAGGFIVVLRPYKVGDFITAAGVTGTVREIGLFVTTINTPDNVQTYIGNNKIFSETIQNFSVNSYRRVDLVAQLNHSVEPAKAIALLKEAIAKIPNVTADPKPDVELLTFTMAGPVLAVRPYCHNDHYGRSTSIPIWRSATLSLERVLPSPNSTLRSGIRLWRRGRKRAKLWHNRLGGSGSHEPRRDHGSPSSNGQFRFADVVISETSSGPSREDRSSRIPLRRSPGKVSAY